MAFMAASLLEMKNNILTDASCITLMVKLSGSLNLLNLRENSSKCIIAIKAYETALLYYILIYWLFFFFLSFTQATGLHHNETGFPYSVNQ